MTARVRHRYSLLRSFLVGVTWLSLACVPLQNLEPIETVWVLEEDEWERLVNRRSLSPVAATESSYVLEHAEAEACLLYIAEVGVSADQFFDREQGGVGKWLWRRGFSILSVAVPEQALDVTAWREKATNHLMTVLRPYKKSCGQRPLVGIGHGIGGSLLLESDVNKELSAVALLSVPLTYAGTSVATQALLKSPLDWGWRDLVGYPVPSNFAGSKTMEEVVSTNQTSSPERFEFYRSETKRLPLTFRRSVLTEVSSVKNLEIRPDIKSWLYGTQPAFIVLPSGNGWVSTWQADPIALGAPASRAKRVYITRANGSIGEFNHFDIFWAEDAITEVWSPLARWLKESQF